MRQCVIAVLLGFVTAECPAQYPSQLPKFEYFHPVPGNVMDRIQRKAAEDWPDDYAQQKFQIECQIKAYHALQDLREARVPTGVLAALKKEAAEDWPDDYSQQEYQIKRQINAFRLVSSYRAPQVPSGVLDGIKQTAAEHWPNNYTQQKREIERQVRAYLARPNLEAVGTVGNVISAENNRASLSPKRARGTVNYSLVNTVKDVWQQEDWRHKPKDKQEEALKLIAALVEIDCPDPDDREATLNYVQRTIGNW